VNTTAKNFDKPSVDRSPQKKKIVANAQAMKLAQDDVKRKTKQINNAANLTWLTESSQTSGKGAT
jgi:hypothetical protein